MAFPSVLLVADHRLLRYASSMTQQVMDKPFGARLKWWREHRGLSQLDCAARREISQRHLSFLESGARRAEPRHGAAPCGVLDVPLRQQNALMLAAGFAPVWRESDLGAPELAQIDAARSTSCWRSRSPIRPSWSTGAGICCAPMPGQGRLVTFLLGAVPAGPVNLADALVAPDVLRPLIENWEEVAVHFLRSVQADAIADGTAETADLLRAADRLSGRAAAVARRAARHATGRCLSIRFRKGDARLSPLHHDRDARHAAGCDLAGHPHRMLLSLGCGERRAVARLGRGGKMATPEMTEDRSRIISARNCFRAPTAMLASGLNGHCS